MEKLYLGISLGFNSSACVYSNVRGILAAISQERLNGEKNTKELPFDAIRECITLAKAVRIEQVAISHYENITEAYFHRYGKRFDLVGETWREYIVNYLANECSCDVVDKYVKRVSHHKAHALSTYGFYGRTNESHYTITSDGFGDALSATISYNDQVISTVKLENSIALVYQFVTGALGFKEHQHEGKITGLAAFGKPIYLDDFKSLYDECDADNGLQFKWQNYQLTDEENEQVKASSIIDFDKFLLLKKAVYGLVNRLVQDGAKREDIAASVQEFSEIYTCRWIRKNVRFYGTTCYLAGGLFANVKINQRIKDLNVFDEVLVCPAMGDEGTCVGAAIAAAESYNFIGTMSEKVISGTSVDDGCVEELFDRLCENPQDYRIFECDDIVDYISHRLADNKIVCLKRGRMEFGPRALCHTSILYNCDTKETNDWLNKKLNRTEFMPFAPVCSKEVADDLFINLDGGRNSAKFMTMTFNCTEEFVKNYPAACHIDNTARPQIISYEDDPLMWNILFGYEKLTGKRALINTSFNLHNNPIIESEKVAIESWLKSDTDTLVIGNVVIEKR